MTDERPTLFDVGTLPQTPNTTLTSRQRATLLRGVHPISGYPLHGQAADVDDRDTDGGLRCRDCYFAVRASNGFKCGVDQGRYVTHAVTSDLQLWFPACTQHVQDTPLTPP